MLLRCCGGGGGGGGGGDGGGGVIAWPRGGVSDRNMFCNGVVILLFRCVGCFNGFVLSGIEG